MHFSTLVLPLTLAIGAIASATPSKSLPLGARQLKPSDVCGDGANDCGDGWCCTAKSTCAEKVNDIPMCSVPGDNSRYAARPYAVSDELRASASSILAEITGLATNFPSDIPDDIEDKVNDKIDELQGKVSEAANSNNAAVRGVDVGFGMGVGAVVGIWGLGVLGGAGWFLM